MRTLDQEDNPEVLRLMAKWLQEELRKTRQELAEARAQKEFEKQTELKLQDQLLVFRKMIFGRSSERRVEKRERDESEEQLLLHSRLLVPPPKENQVRKLESEIVEHELSDEDLRAESLLRELAEPSCGQWEKVESFIEESRELHVLERRYVIRVHKQQKYRLKKEFNESDKEVIITAPGPVKLIPGCQHSIAFAVSVVADRYISHMPFERQTREMASLGLYNMNTKTLYNLSQAVSVHLEPVAERIKQEIMSSSLALHADETPWPIQMKEQDDGQMWVISNQTGSYFAFEPSRSGLVIKDLLKGYQGVVLCDGYTGYNRLKTELEGIRLAHCWAHARRKFVEIELNYPEECKEILDLMRDLFVYEREAKDFQELLEIRAGKSQLRINDIEKWVEQTRAQARDGSKLLEAIDYLRKYWVGLTLFLDDPFVPLTNNEAERTIRHAVMGRKNSYGSRTHNGADVAATLYTIIESCKKVQMDPRTYIQMAVELSAKGKSPPTPFQHAKLTYT